MTQSYCGTSETKLILTFPQNIEQGPQVALIVTFTSFDSKFYTHRSVVVARRRLVTRGKLPGSSAIILDLMIMQHCTWDAVVGGSRQRQIFKLERTPQLFKFKFHIYIYEYIIINSL